MFRIIHLSARWGIGGVVVKKNITCFALAFLTIVFLPNILKSNLENSMYTNSILTLFLFIGLYFCFQKTESVLERRLLCVSIPIGFLFSSCMVFGTSLYRFEQTAFTSIVSWACILALTPLFTAVVALLIKHIDYINGAIVRNDSKAHGLKGRHFFTVWIIIFVSWIPFFLASYPGVFGYDSIHQANWYRDGVINLQHPIIHTYLLGFCVVTIGSLLGSYEAGMAVYSIFQMLCLSCAFSMMYTFFIRKRMRPLFRRLILLWYMFFPVNPIMAFSSTKDVLFSAFFALTLMLLLILAETPKVLRTASYCIALTISVFFMIVFRSQGIYVFLLTILIAIIILGKYRKQLMFVALSCMIVFGLYSGPFTKWLGGVESNSLREMMSVPCVQLSRAMTNNAEELTSEEKQLIEEYISGYYIYPVNSGISDMMKGTLDTERLKNNPMEFIKLWLKVGIKCPGTYIDAFARLTIGLWYPDMNYRDPLAYHPYWEYWSTGSWNGFGDERYIQMKQVPIKGFEVLYNILSRLSYDNIYQKLPVISMVFSSGLSIWSVILYCAFCIYKKFTRHIIPIVFLGGLILTLFLGPVVLFRYVYPIFISLPMLLASTSYQDAQGNVLRSEKN